MKFDRPNRTSSQALATSGIDAANYAERAKAFVAGRGIGFVIRAIEGTNGEARSNILATEPQWAAWMAYFDAKGVKHKFVDSHGIATVPCEWPEDFDLEWSTSDLGARLPRKRVPFDPDRRSTANQVRAATEHMEVKPKKRARDWHMSPEEADEFMREAGAKPVARLSPAALATLGIAEQEDAA